MNPLVTAILISVALAVFTHSMYRRWLPLRAATPKLPFDQPLLRLRRALQFTLGQKRLSREPLAGFAHKAIFFGFIVLLLRSLILFARGFINDPHFGYGIFNDGAPLGNAYSLLKDLYILLVILGTLIFLHLRLIKKLHRLTQSREAILILAIILTMMLADLTYDAAGHLLHSQIHPPPFNPWQPLGSTLALPLAPLAKTPLTILYHAGFWTHITLVLLFLTLLPHTKHFHIITILPNAFFRPLSPPGRIAPLQDIEGRLEREESLGLATINDCSAKDILDLYTCTECGRCTTHCPAAATGKILSPKQIILDLRDQCRVGRAKRYPPPQDGKETTAPQDSSENDDNAGDLTPDIISPEALWACTTCGACVQECPVLIDPLEKIINLRRHLVMEKGEIPEPLQESFSSTEVLANPYGSPPDQRLDWTQNLPFPVPLASETPNFDLLFWVGCAPATDERAKNIARATVKLLHHANINFAILGPEESCTGDSARRAGNEYLFQQMAEQNINTLNRYAVKKILTICPHCFNTLKNEYPDYGGNYEVLHHTEYLNQLVTEGKLTPTHPLNQTITYHDSCYLGRHNNIYDSPRNLLQKIPGVTLIEPAQTRDRAQCCGAGGSQSFKEEEPGTERISAARTKQLKETKADTICSACPFCLRMFTNELNEQEDSPPHNKDLAEILWSSIAP